MYTKTLLTAALASAAVAAPLETKSQAFSLITTHSGNQFVHLRPVEAVNWSFWIGKETRTSCPAADGVDCSTLSNDLSVVATPNTASPLSMNVIVPGGQQVFVNADGELGYTHAHSSQIPAGSLLEPFEYTPATDSSNGNLLFNGQSFTACHSETANAFQIYALGAPAFTRTDCIEVSLVQVTPETPVPAWQYD